MTSRTHDAFAFAALVTFAAIFPPEQLKLTTLVVCVMAADIGALLPDMDQAGNRLREMLPAGHDVGKIFRRVFYKHRTITPSLLGVLIVYLLLESILPKILNSGFLDTRIIINSVMIGYISHLFSDGLTEEGLPLLFPFRISFGFPPIRKMRIKTGKWFENLVVYPAVWIYVVWFIQARSDIFLKIIESVNK